MAKNIFIGDSNVGPFSSISNMTYKYYTNEDLKIFTNKNKLKEESSLSESQTHNFTGSSMYGITKNGRMKTGDRINKITDSKNKKYFFIFGFVDINFVIPYKKIKGEEFSRYKFLKETSKKFIKFIYSLKRDIVIFEVPYITLTNPEKYNEVFLYWFVDEEHKQKAIEYLKNKPYEQKKHIKMTKHFNKLLEKYCKEYKIPFIKYNHCVMNQNNNIDKKFIISDSDHHYKFDEILPIYLNEIKKLF